MPPKGNKPSASTLPAVHLAAALTAFGCGGEATPGAAVSASSRGAVSTADVPLPASAASAITPLPSADTAPSAAAPVLTIASIRADAAANPARFKGTKVTLDGYFSARSQSTFGSGEHPIHHFVIVHVAITRGDTDTLRCVMSENTWPPAGLAPGDSISVSGLWSTDRVLRGGFAEGGGPLHIAGCKVARRSVDAPAER